MTNLDSNRWSSGTACVSCWIAVSALGLLVLSGCSGFGGKNAAWMTPPWSKKPEPTSAERVGIKAPYQRMVDLQETAKRASSMPADEQQRTAHKIAEEFRAEDDPLIRAQMVRTLAGFSGNDATAALGEAMEDSSLDVRIAACQAWGRRGGPEAVELLGNRVASDTNVDVRLAAARALGETGDEKAVAKLGVALDDGDPALQYRAVLALQKVTGKSFDNDVNQWRQYVKGETPTPAKPTSVAERVREIF
ncbi:MAG TPA: HEAT repeat domain-containing protein [Thermoguttaceae bacterium]|nr:HEAT repeat domain-containing protein [Thermoguttaceae bacterium]